MIRKGLVIGIKPEFIGEYKKTHSDVWPDILEKISESKIKNYSIFAQEDRLFAFFEYHGNDFEKDMKKASVFLKDDEIRKYSISRALENSNSNKLFLEFGVYKGDSINTFADYLLKKN